MLITSSLIAAFFNRALTNELSRFSGYHIALNAGVRRWVFLIVPGGRLAAANKLIDADCLISWKNGAVHISGDSELFQALSLLRQKTDWLALFSGLFGERLAPRVLYRLEQGSGELNRLTERYFIQPSEAAAYYSAVQSAHEQVMNLAKRIDKLGDYHGKKTR